MNKFIEQLGQSRIMLSFIIIVGAIIGYLGYSNLDTPVVPDDLSLHQRTDSIESFANLNIDFSILDNEIFKTLEIFGENPVDPGITGERTNPFAPI